MNSYWMLWITALVLALMISIPLLKNLIRDLILIVHSYVQYMV